MATVLMTWELGGGLGHMVPMRAIGDGLVRAGHSVFAALRDLTDAARVFGGSPIRCVQAPFKQRTTDDAKPEILTFAHILWNTGFSDLMGLQVLAGAWRTMFQGLRPDLVLFDHSPAALLASRGLPLRRVLLGTGFAHPPDPLPILRPWIKADSAVLSADERHILLNVNSVLRAWGEKPFDTLADLYKPIEESLLLTLPALDPYTPRNVGRYFTVSAAPDGQEPQWPISSGPRVFGYLKPFAAIGSLLSALRELKAPTLIFAPEVDPRLKAQLRSETLQFSNVAFNMRSVADQCDLAILNGTNAAVVQFLLAGKPTLQIPLMLEQINNARAVQNLGAGLAASPIKPNEVLRRLNELLEDPSFGDNARRFAAANAKVQEPLAAAIDRLLGLLADSAGERASH